MGRSVPRGQQPLNDGPSDGLNDGLSDGPSDGPSDGLTAAASQSTAIPLAEETPLAAIILCGGQSKRMGRSKASLPFGDQSMLQRVVSRLDAAPGLIEPIVLVATVDQPAPRIQRSRGTWLIARDERPDRGPLEGLIAGMQALLATTSEVARTSERARQLAYATSCDVPLLSPAWPHTIARQLIAANSLVAVPVDDQHHHPLAAVYDLAVLPTLLQLSQQDELRPRRLFDRVSTKRIPVEQLRHIDPELDTLFNLNTPEDYRAALDRAGLANTDTGF